VWIERGNRRFDGCGTPDVFRWRAAWIKREREKVPSA
jgi:hypothetical protein